MNTASRFPRCAGKVIASGRAPNGRLRATVMLTPSGDIDDLPGWPGRVLKALKDADWSFELSVVVLRTLGAGNESCKATSYQEAIKQAFRVGACADAAARAWNGETSFNWVDALWRDGFTSKLERHSETAAWSALSKLIQDSQGLGMLKPGIKPDETRAGESDAAKRLEAVKQAAATAGQASVEVSTIIPSRQTDLAVLLETQRALELCDTAKWAHGGIEACSATEAVCASVARRGPPPPTPSDKSRGPLAAMREQALSQFKGDRTAPNYGVLCSGKLELPKATVVTPGAARKDIELQLHPVLDTHEAATRQEEAAQPSDDRALRDAIGQRFFAAQGSPALSRLFALTFDVILETELDLSEGSAEAVLMLGMGDEQLQPSDKSLWTLAKYRKATGHFWPATSLDLHATQPREVLDPMVQIDGMIVLGQSVGISGTNEGRTARFQMTSLNVQAASEAAIDRRRRPLAPPAEVNSFKLSRRPADWARKTLLTTGLVLLDRGRQAQAVSQLAARAAHGNSAVVVLDADDLLIGYRVDVALPMTGHGMRWRTLMARQFAYGTDGPWASRVRGVTHLLLGSPGSDRIQEWQHTLEEAVVGLPARLVPGSEPGKVDAYVEEAVVAWSGEPMGAHCAGKVKSAELSIGAGDRVSLPSGPMDRDRLLPPLRFGWPYRMGLRAVYAGGISVPLREAASRYDSDEFNGKLTQPPHPANSSRGTRRFLRHERIDAPFLLMHQGVALRRNGVMGYERAAHAIVRSAPRGPEHRRGLPASTQRIIAPSFVSHDFAAMHGVLDADTQARPRDALRHVRFDAPSSGFPVAIAEMREGKDHAPFSGTRSIQSIENAEGDLVYQEVAQQRRSVPYFPDPVVRHYVIGVRYAETDVYLPGAAFTVPMYPKGSRYPDARVLALNIVRSSRKGRSADCPQLEQVLSHGTQAPSRGPFATTGAAQVTLTLAPGDDFQVDVWCIPGPSELAKHFALVEAIGVLVRSKASDANNKIDLKVLAQAMRQLLPEPMCAVIEERICRKPLDFDFKDDADTEDRFDGLGGLAVPGRRVLLAIATALFETLCRRPIDEIAAVQTFRATHATAYPTTLPMEAHKDAVKVTRLIGASPVTLVTPVPPVAQVAAQAAAGLSASVPTATAAVVAPEYALSGDLLIHLATTGGFELRANTASPTTMTFDDKKRGRTTRDRRDGVWPKAGHSGLGLTTTEVFGFDVAADGGVTLPRIDIKLLSISKLPRPVPDALLAQREGSLWTLPLEKLDQGESKFGKVNSRHIFPDQKARLLDLRIVPVARHELLMTTENRTGERLDGQWMKPGVPVSPVDPGPANWQVWIPAGIRPSEPLARSPTVAFVWKHARDSLWRTASRRALVRIPLRREWYSSGEGERLGIVMWPPAIFGFSAEQLEALSRDRIPAAGEPMQLPDFVDEDLGPGGRFITRWGSDPIRPAIDAAGAPSFTFVNPGAIQAGPGFQLIHVPEARMPVRTGPGDMPKANEPAEQTMPVALATFEPKFDIETEEWFVDVMMEHPFEAEPFVRLGLVRYQPQAPADLQVSFPVVQWVQLLPRRDVRARLEHRAPGARTVQVWIEGRAARALGADEMKFGNPVRHQMRLRIVREYINEAGLRCQRVMRTEQMAMRQLEPAESAHNELTQWSTEPIAIGSDSQVDRRERAIYAAYIEEFESRLPAVHADEPVSSKMAHGEKPDDAMIHAGPRFSARLEL